MKLTDLLENELDWTKRKMHSTVEEFLSSKGFELLRGAPYFDYSSVENIGVLPFHDSWFVPGHVYAIGFERDVDQAKPNGGKGLKENKRYTLLTQALTGDHYLGKVNIYELKIPEPQEIDPDNLVRLPIGEPDKKGRIYLGKELMLAVAIEESAKVATQPALIYMGQGIKGKEFYMQKSRVAQIVSNLEKVSEAAENFSPAEVSASKLLLDKYLPLLK